MSFINIIASILVTADTEYYITEIIKQCSVWYIQAYTTCSSILNFQAFLNFLELFYVSTQWIFFIQLHEY